MFKLTFLGTSAGMPTKHRNVTGLAIAPINPYNKTKENPWILIDCGEGTQHQLLHTSLSLLQLKIICITHVHGDHCYGLPGLLASMAMLGRTTPLTLIAPLAISKLLDTLTITTELYFPFDIQFIAIEQQLNLSNNYQPIKIGLLNHHDIIIDIVALSHRTPSYAFKLTQKIQYHQLNHEKLYQLNIPPSNIWGKLQQGQDVIVNEQLLRFEDFVKIIHEKLSIVIAGDNDSPNLLSHMVEDAMLLVHEATYTQTIADKIAIKNHHFNPQHSSAKVVAEFAKTYALPNLILTHFSARYQPFDDVNNTTLNMGHIRTEVEKYYQGNYWLAEDFAEFDVTTTMVKWNNIKF